MSAYAKESRLTGLLGIAIAATVSSSVSAPQSTVKNPILRRQGYLLFVSLLIFLSAITRVKQSGQANRTLPVGVRDNGRIVAASTNRLHSGHRFVFEGSLPINSRFAINTEPRFGGVFSAAARSGLIQT